MQNGSFTVRVSASSVTTHTVTVPAGLAEELGIPTDTVAGQAALIEESFTFLLDREPNTSILRNFSVEVIGDYYPEWRTVIKARFEEGARR